MSIDWKNNYDDIKDKLNTISSQMDETYLVVANDINILKDAGKETREQLEALTIGDLTIIGFVPRLNQREGSYEKFTSGLDNDLEPRIKIGVGELTSLGASNKNGDLNISYDLTSQTIDFAFETNLTRTRRPETIVLWSDIQGLIDNGGTVIDKVQVSENIIDTHTEPGKEELLMNSWMTQKDSQDTILFQNIDTINTNLISTNVKIDNEITTREEADASLQTQIDSIVGFDLSDYYVKSEVDTLILNETNARTSADTQLQTNITNEETSRISGDNTLQTNIDLKVDKEINDINSFKSIFDETNFAEISAYALSDITEIRLNIENDNLNFYKSHIDNSLTFIGPSNLDKSLSNSFAQMSDITNSSDLIYENIDIINTNLIATNVKIDNEITNRTNADNILQGNIEVVANNIIENKKESSTGLGLGTYPATPTKGTINNFNFPVFSGTYYSTSGSTLTLNQNADTFDFGAKLNINNAQNAKIVEILVNGVVYESKNIPSTNSQLILFNVTMKNVVAGSYLIQFRIENVGGNLVIASAPTFYFGYGVYGTIGTPILNSSDVIDDHLTVSSSGINSWMNQKDVETSSLFRDKTDNYSSYIGMSNATFYNMFSSYFVADTTGTMRVPSNSLFTYLMDTLVDGGFSSSIKGGYYEPSGSTDNYIVFMIFGKLPI